MTETNPEKKFKLKNCFLSDIQHPLTCTILNFKPGSEEILSGDCFAHGETSIDPEDEKCLQEDCRFHQELDES